MILNIKNEQACQLAGELARLTGGLAGIELVPVTPQQV